MRKLLTAAGLLLLSLFWACHLNEADSKDHFDLKLDGQRLVLRFEAEGFDRSPLTRADLARATAAWLRADPASLRTAPGAAADRPGRVVLDSAMAAATLGIHCRPVSAVLR